MKTINVDGDKYNVPEYWYEIPLKDFVKFMDLLHNSTNKDHTILFQISAFCNIDLDKVKKMNPRYLPEFLNTLSFLQLEPELKPCHEFEHNGNKYSIINHLLNSQTQDFVSLMATEKDQEKTPWRSLGTKVAILAKRKKEDNTTETLDDYDISTRTTEFQDLPITVVKSIDSFFLLASKMFLIDSPTLLKKQNEVNLLSIESAINSVKPRVGTRWYGKWLMKMFVVYLKYIGKGWSRYYSTTLSNQENQK